MIFQKKVDRALQWLKDKNKSNEIKEGHEVDQVEPLEDLPLEKGDRLALLLSALLVFGPIFLILLIIALFAYF